MLEIYSDKKYRVVPNNVSGWEFQERQKDKKAESGYRWSATAWPTTINGAFQILVRKHLCSDDCQTVVDALKEIERISRAITEALEPHISIDLKSVT